jgi:hypothetical protein
LVNSLSSDRIGEYSIALGTFPTKLFLNRFRKERNKLARFTLYKTKLTKFAPRTKPAYPKSKIA